MIRKGCMFMIDLEIGFGFVVRVSLGLGIMRFSYVLEPCTYLEVCP